MGVHPVTTDSGPVADLVLLHDLGFIERRSQDTRQYLIVLIVLIAALAATTALTTVVVAQLSWRGWVAGARALLRGEGLVRPIIDDLGEIETMLQTMPALLRSRQKNVLDRQFMEPPSGGRGSV